MVRTASPLTAHVVDPILCELPPASTKVWPPAEARTHYGLTRPAQ